MQCDAHIRDYKIPTPAEIEKSNDRLLPLYVKHDLPQFLYSYNRSEWHKAINDLKPYIKPDASPGVPHTKVSTRNDKLLEAMGERFNEVVLNRVESLIALDLATVKNMDRRERIDNNLVDPVRVFVKNEPHKRAKIDEGRVRLIMSVSLTDKVIEMLLSRHICKLEIQNWRRIPSKPGIGFDEIDNEEVAADIFDSGYEMRASDVKGWDWNVKQWQITDEAESLINLAKTSSPVWEHLLRCKAVLESESVYQFSDGTLVAPTFPGIVNSGKLRTSRGNSWMRVRVADLVGSKKTIAAGDDAVESYVPDAVEKYKALGIALKVYDKVDSEFEFCSRIYSRSGSYALNKEKMIMNLLHQEPKNFLEYRSAMIGLTDELSSRPDFQDILGLVEAAGFYEVEGPHYI